MTATITANNAAGATSPRLVLGYQTARESRNVVHDLIGGGIAVVLATPRPRSGDLRLLYTDGSAASGYEWVDGYYVPTIPAVDSEVWDAIALFAERTTFALTVGERPQLDMTFVVAGEVELELDPQTRKAWVVVVPYQEVAV